MTTSFLLALLPLVSAAMGEPVPDPHSPSFFAGSNLLERSQTRLDLQRPDFEIRKKPLAETSGDHTLELIRNGEVLFRWESTDQSSFMLYGGNLYYASTPRAASAPTEVRKRFLATGEDSLADTLPPWNNDKERQTLWLAVEESAVVAYQYSPSHGISAKRLAGQGTASGAILHPGPRRLIALCPPALTRTIKPMLELRMKQGYLAEILEVTAANTPEALARIAAIKREPRFGDCLLLVGALDTGDGARADCVLDLAKGSHGRMTGKTADSVLGLQSDNSLPLLIVGRLPAGSPEELERMIRKIGIFEEGKGVDAGQVAFITGNPMPGNEQSKMANSFLNSQSENMRKRLDPAWEIGGVADVSGSAFYTKHEDFHRRVGEVLSAPWEVLAVFGHSNPQGLWSGDDCSLTAREWNALAGQGRHRLFFTCGCHALQNQSAYAVAAIRAENGPAASVGASGESWSAIGYLAGGGLADCLCGKGPQTLGEWWLAIQQGIAWGPLSALKFAAFDQIDGTNGKTSLKDQRLEHLEMWSLLGDPTMTMAPATP